MHRADDGIALVGAKGIVAVVVGTLNGVQIKSLIEIKDGVDVGSGMLITLARADDGLEVGTLVGANDGLEVGTLVGANEGLEVGMLVGANDGLRSARWLEQMKGTWWLACWLEQMMGLWWTFWLVQMKRSCWSARWLV